MRDLTALVARLDLDIGRIRVCHACLSFVSLPLDAGDDREARREARRLTPALWEEGLSGAALPALEHACRKGVPGADAALADLERNAGRSAVARAIVLRLAAELVERCRTEMRLEAAAREQLGLAPPEWN
ncbi:MAG TPA: hypothetical protein VEH55_03005 [Gaiellaceae bacterium]|nr:hypothetical protein [Gaiellaceae bacterium]